MPLEITVKAKIAGLWRDKVSVTDPSGERGPRYLISDRDCEGLRVFDGLGGKRVRSPFSRTNMRTARGICILLAQKSSPDSS
jgi:hypothetical protein